MIIKLGKYKRLLINRTGQPDKRYWNNSGKWYMTRYPSIFGFFIYLFEYDTNSGN
jgi:hypothetical protein